MPAASGPATSGSPGRPPVSVIVPFGGSDRAVVPMLARLSRLRLGPRDELIIADNSERAVVAGGDLPGRVQVIRAARERSSYYARNVGAEASTAPWLLFMDADCDPEEQLLDAYFARPVAADVAILAGAVLGDPTQSGLIPAWARSRRQLSEEHLLQNEALPHPATGTGNVLIRREPFEALGGFHEGIRSGGDVELCWRLQDAGWRLEHRPEARVLHRYRRTARALAAQAARHSAGRLWLNRRYPGAWPRPRLISEVALAIGGAVFHALRLRPQRSLFRLIDLVPIVSAAAGWTLGRNGVEAAAPSPERRPDTSLLTITDAFPARSETFVYNECLTLARKGWGVRVESLARPARIERAVARRLPIAYLEDDAPRRKALDLLWLCATRPHRCLADLAGRRRWRDEEPVWPLAAIAPAARRLALSGERHLHAHFAAGGALTAMRLASLLGTPYSLTAHAYDIYQRPRNLGEKLSRASFAVAECESTAHDLRAACDGATPVHVVRTGTDPERFRRRRPYPGGRRVLAVGRLVEKKGFAHLVRAAALLGDAAEEVCIAGEGPEAAALARLVDELELSSVVRLRGAAWGPGVVRELLEGADVLAVPSVIAADGDRDALPLVIYEALAMEVPVVASDIAGIGEVVRSPWGELVPPGDPVALAEALARTLSLPRADRAAAGAEGRRFVVEHCDAASWAERLGELIRNRA